jgi:hypothetical protein
MWYWIVPCGIVIGNAWHGEKSKPRNDVVTSTSGFIWPKNYIIHAFLSGRLKVSGRRLMSIIEFTFSACALPSPAAAEANETARTIKFQLTALSNLKQFVPRALVVSATLRFESVPSIYTISNNFLYFYIFCPCCSWYSLKIWVIFVNRDQNCGPEFTRSVTNLFPANDSHIVLICHRTTLIIADQI